MNSNPKSERGRCSSHNICSVEKILVHLAVDSGLFLKIWVTQSLPDINPPMAEDIA